MWSSDSAVTGGRRRPLALALALGLSALAGGCLRPLYADGTASTLGVNVREVMKSVEIPELKGIVGHYLRNELVFELDGGGDADMQRKFRLAINISENIEVVAVDYTTGRADSAILVATADWSLRRIGSDEVVSSGQSVARAPYERSTQRFATIRAARDAQIRAAKTLAPLIRDRIAADVTAR